MGASTPPCSVIYRNEIVTLDNQTKTLDDTYIIITRQMYKSGNTGTDGQYEKTPGETKVLNSSTPASSFTCNYTEKHWELVIQV